MPPFLILISILSQYEEINLMIKSQVRLMQSYPGMIIWNNAIVGDLLNLKAEYYDKAVLLVYTFWVDRL